MAHDKSALTIPLISTTATLTLAIFEYILFSGLARASHIDKHSTARTISLWWKTTYFHGLFLILTLGLTSLIGGFGAVRALGSGGWEMERRTALVGTVAAVGHFAFARAVVRCIDEMCGVYDEKEKGLDGKLDDRVVELNGQWLRVHVVRSLMADLPAFLCFAWLALHG